MKNKAIIFASIIFVGLLVSNCGKTHPIDGHKQGECKAWSFCAPASDGLSCKSLDFI